MGDPTMNEYMMHLITTDIRKRLEGLTPINDYIIDLVMEDLKKRLNSELDESSYDSEDERLTREQEARDAYWLLRRTGFD